MKQILTLFVFLLIVSAGFTQVKGKDKKEKQKKEIKTSVPAPTDQGGKPEVNKKQKPVIFQSGDTSKAGSFPTQSGSPAPAPSQSGNAAGSPTSSGSTSGGQTQPTPAGEPTSGQSSGSGSPTPSTQTNPPSTNQSGGGAENSKTAPGSKKQESSKDDDDDDDHEFKKDKKDKKVKKDKQKEFKDDDDNDNGNGNSKTRINIPTQVRNSFNRDYPNATNAVWTKNRGDWTVTFGNSNWNSTATYHSNGERVDTRTPVRRDEAPQPVQEEILKRFPQTNPKDIIKIEKPKNPNLFQVVVEQAGKIKTMVFDEKGKLVSQMQDIIK